jgi:hypothetical protein
MSNDLNRLERLLSATLHSSGRREDRRNQSVKMNARFASPEEAQRAILKGEYAKTLPIKRKEPKRPKDMSARQWRIQQRAERQAHEIPVRAVPQETAVLLDCPRQEPSKG